MRLIFHPEARAEFQNDVDYYARQRRGYGIRFADIIESTIRRIFANPARGGRSKAMSGGV